MQMAQGQGVHTGGSDTCGGNIFGEAGAGEHTCTGKLPRGGCLAHLQLPDDFHWEGRAIGKHLASEELCHFLHGAWLQIWEE